MAETDFSIIGASAASMARGVTSGFTKPNGGGNFVFGFNSLETGPIATCLYYNATNFAPLRDDESNATGGSIRAAMMRGRSETATDFSVFVFINLQNTSVSDTGYLLGLSGDNPAQIVLAKTTPETGLDPDSTLTLAKSTETYLWDIWVHLRLDAICNPNGDVILRCFQNDLSLHTVSSPTWEEISGLEDVTDDALGVTSGSNPLSGGYGGFGFNATNAQSRGFVDYVEFLRQM